MKREESELRKMLSDVLLIVALHDESINILSAIDCQTSEYRDVPVQIGRLKEMRLLI
jgi:hypothetical protein